MGTLGRISGPLLKSNLVRDGVDLAFETDLLKLDVTNRRIGINTAAPTYDLEVNGTTNTTNLIVDNTLTIGNFTVTGNTISSNLNTITFSPSGGDPTIYHAKLDVDDIRITGNTISSTTSNSSIDIQPNGTGQINLQANTNVTGNLYVTGNINATGNVTIGGNIVIGDNISDTVTINAAIKSDIIPETDTAYDLGSPSLRWRSLYANNFYADVFSSLTLNIGDLQFYDNVIATTAGQDLYIDGNGAGGVRLGNFKIVDNTITNVVADAISLLVQSGTGYFKIVGTNGFVPPKGTELERPAVFEIGMTRYNTETKALEIWDGSVWASPAGTSGAVSEIQANDIAAAFALTLG